MRRSLRSFMLLAIPATLVYAIFMFGPIMLSMRYSFYQWNGFGPKTFVWFDNFIRLFTEAPFNERFFNALINNIQFFITTMVVQNAVALVIALLLNRELSCNKFFRTLFFAPTTISVIIVGFLWTLIYNPMWGVINNLLDVIGLDNLKKAWLGEPGTALTAIAIANAWQYIGIPMMLFLAGLQGISGDLIEASHIDGCNSRQQFRFITFPLLMPIVYMVTILTFVGNFTAFEIIFAMEGTSAGPMYSTDILGTFFYRTTYGSLSGAVPEMGLGAAIAACMFVLVLACVGIGYYFDSKKSTY